MLSLRKTLGVFVLLLCALGSARLSSPDFPINTLLALPFAEKYKSKDLYDRAPADCDRSGFDDPDVPTCVALCAPDGDPCAGDSTALKKQRRSPEHQGYLEADSDGWALTNASAETHHRVKRAWPEITQDQLADYIRNQFDAKTVDPHFKAITPLVEYFTKPDGSVVETDHTVTEQIEFAQDAFQVGSRGIHGCTMVTVVSRRAVYMGHFWEKPSWANNAEFKQRVINHISGRVPRFGIGPSLDQSLFDRAGDDTRVYIMAPRRSPNAPPQNPNYRAKLPTLKTLLNGPAPDGQVPNAPTALWLYKRVDTGRPAESELLSTTQRGHAVFQFDPNGRGPGVLGWRLFYEEHVFTDTDPPPDADSANGIPDL